ncbi:MAG: DUF262 domain-containing protein [Acidimicrobiales bacterium]
MSSIVQVTKLEARSFALDDLVFNVRAGKVRLPDFQRRFRWTASDIERLFDSIYRGYPIGTLLFWKRQAPGGIVAFGGVEWSVPEVPEALWVIDGQQRITSLTLAVLSDLRAAELDRRFNLYFDPQTEEFKAAATGRGVPDDLLPVATAFDLTRVLEWISLRGLSDGLRDRAFALTKRLRDFQVPAYLVETGDEQAVREIFDRMNTFGRRMKRSEVFDALHSAMHLQGEELRLSWVGEAATEAGFGEIDEQQLLYAVLATRGPDVLRDFHREFSGDGDRAEAFANARSALGRAIAFLQADADVAHARLIPHQHLFVALVRFLHLYPFPSPRNRVLLRRWFWRAAVIGPHLKGGTTGTLRQTVAAVSSGGEFAAVSALLNLSSTAQTSPPAPSTEQVRLSTADSRITLSAMMALGPLSPFDREAIPPDDIFGPDRAPLPQIFSSGDLAAGASSTGNRLLLPESELIDVSPRDALLSAVAEGDDELGRSHVIDEVFISLAEAGDFQGAVSRRSEQIRSHVLEFVASRAEWDLVDRPAIAALVADDE